MHAARASRERPACCCCYPAWCMLAWRRGTPCIMRRRILRRHPRGIYTLGETIGDSFLIIVLPSPNGITLPGLERAGHGESTPRGYTCKYAQYHAAAESTSWPGTRGNMSPSSHAPYRVHVTSSHAPYRVHVASSHAPYPGTQPAAVNGARPPRTSTSSVPPAGALRVLRVRVADKALSPSSGQWQLAR